MSESPTPNPTDWERIEEVCFEAMQLDASARADFLEARCAGEPDLRARVDTLLRAADEHPTFLEEPVVKIDNIPGETDPVPTSPVRFGPYRVIRPLGRGGMGAVYLAQLEREDFTRSVAIKVIRPGFDTERVLERFRAERRILAGLRHPNVATLLDGGVTDEGRPWFAMEYIDGVPIDEYCDMRRADVHERIRLMLAVCAAVHHAHQNLVVHRDIKPGNVLVGQDGAPKLLDFGIGKLLEEESSRPQETLLAERAMTPEFAAPEQLDGGRITTATDVFGLGVLLYRLLSGELPYGATTDPTEAREARNRPPLRPSARVAGDDTVPRELDAIVLKALAEEPEDRYSGPSALAEDLERWLDGRPVRARPPSIGYTARKFVSRNRVAVASAFVLMLGAAGGTAYTWQQSRRVAAERDKALEVRGFLLETFGAAGPDRTTGDPVTARAILDRQAETVVETYAADPALRAEMMTVLAEGYERLGLLTEAQTWASRVVTGTEGVDASTVVAGSTLLGWVLHQQGRSGEARDTLVSAVTRSRRLPGAERTLARALNDLGVVEEALGNYDPAARAHEEAMALRARLFGAEHRSVGVSASNLSAVHYRRGDLDAAVTEAERALELVRRAFGPDHQRSIIVQSNLAVFKLVQGDLAGAEADYRDLLDRQRRLQGERHPVTLRVMLSLAAVLRQAQAWTEAEEMLREALRIQEEGESTNPVDVAFTLSALGDVLSARGEHVDGVALVLRARDLQIDALGSAHVDVAQSESYLVSAYERVDSIADAIVWQERVVATLTAALGADHPQLDGERERLEDLRRRPPD